MNSHLLTSKRAILAATNKSTDEFNMILQNKVPGRRITLYSADSTVIDEKSNPDNKHH